MRRGRLILFLLLLICGGLYAVSSNPELAKMRDATATAKAIQAVATKIVQRETDEFVTQTAAVEATNFALTPKTATPTMTASATITDTPLPTETIPASPTDAPPETWFITSTANLRSCPRTDCDRVAQLQRGNEVTVIGQVQGEVYKGSDLWQRVTYNGQEVYVHSSLVSNIRPVITAAPAEVQNFGQQPSPISVQPQSQQWQCGGDIYNCSDFTSRAVLMDYWNTCPGDPSNLDGHPEDGIPCNGIK